MGSKNKILNNLDWLTVGLYFLLVFLGWMNIYAAVYNPDHQNIFDISQKYGKQMMWIAAGIVLIIVIFLIDSKLYSAFPYPIYLLVMFLLFFVLLFGREVNGARSWIEIGAFRLQPAEFAKLATALAIAKYTSTFNFNLLKIKNFIVVGTILFVPAFFILLQNDTGSALVYSTFLLVLYREGLPGWILGLVVFIITLFISTLLIGFQYVTVYLLLLASLYYLLFSRDFKSVLISSGTLLAFYTLIYILNYYMKLELSSYSKLFIPLLISSLIFIYYAFRKNISRIYAVVGLSILSLLFMFSVDYVFTNVLRDHQRDRINNLLGIEFDPLGAGYNVNQSLIAIGSGNFYGKGFLEGTQTKFDFVPEQSTDFIFCTVGEEWGFIGTTTVLVLFMILLIRIIIISERQRSSFTRIYGYGVASIFFFHIIINVGMTIGLAPVIGIPLPFFSYGGSSLWTFTILLFILLRLDVSRDELLN